MTAIGPDELKHPFGNYRKSFVHVDRFFFMGTGSVGQLLKLFFALLFQFYLLWNCNLAMRCVICYSNFRRLKSENKLGYLESGGPEDSIAYLLRKPYMSLVILIYSICHLYPSFDISIRHVIMGCHWVGSMPVLVK